jgi:malonyl-ACP decarboxylase
MDTDLCGFCTEQLGIRGLAYTVGGASASGQLAVIQAASAVRTGQVDVCIALGALMDLSYWECHGFRAIGAMGTDRYTLDPARACRPFDRDCDGFIFGESCGALVLESLDSARARNLSPYAALRGCGMAMDANRNPNPSCDGEARAIGLALADAGWIASAIDYVNPHGTGSQVGDSTEVEALRRCGIASAYINTTKSLIGHGLTAAGTVEIVATLLQMRFGRLHPSRNLENPIDKSLNWVCQSPIDHSIGRALTLSIGFGGMNTALCWQQL